MEKNKKIQYLKPSEIIPYFNNPRKNDEAVVKVAESIKAFGFQAPIIVDSNKVIVAGHTRWKAALKLELKEVPVIVADDLDETKAKAYRIADNRVGEFAEWDWQRLEIEMAAFDDELKALLDFNVPDIINENDISEKKLNELYEVVIECKNEQEQEQTYNKIIEMGFECRLLTL